MSFNINSLFCFPNLPLFFNLLFTNFYFLNFNNVKISKYITTSTNNKESISYQLDSNDMLNSSNKTTHQFMENSQSQRFNRFNSLLINYDYKTGHYIGN
jgi:hypothetical protein